MSRVRKVLWWTLAVFAVYSIVTAPAQAADIVSTAWNILAQGVQSIARFFDALLNRP